MTDSERVELTHVAPDGSARMVDVGDKDVTVRVAVAQSVLITRPEVVDAVLAGALPKGEAVGTARIAGIMAAKQTSTLIPLCHPLPLSSVVIDIAGSGERITVVATAKTVGKTGVEMEALTAATVSALTLYDMVKAVDRTARITDVLLLEKSGGKSGSWVRP